MIYYRPQDLPRLRADLIEFAQSSEAVRWRQNDMDEGYIAREPAATLTARRVRGLREADLFFVTPEMAELVEAAARTLPEFALAPDDPPSRAGLAWFARPVEDHFADGYALSAVAACWQIVVIGGQEAVEVTPYVSRDKTQEQAIAVGKPRSEVAHWTDYPPVLPLATMRATLLEDGTPELIDPAGPGRAVLASVKTLWLLMRQPTLAVETAGTYDRAMRRRAAREGWEPPPVRVLSLRRPAGNSTGQGEGREWHHRWIVRGHWRNQAHGPGRAERRPVWIAPFMKGPEDAPLLGGDKVYRVT